MLISLNVMVSSSVPTWFFCVLTKIQVPCWLACFSFSENSVPYSSSWRTMVPEKRVVIRGSCEGSAGEASSSSVLAVWMERVTAHYNQKWRKRTASRTEACWWVVQAHREERTARYHGRGHEYFLGWHSEVDSPGKRNFTHQSNELRCKPIVFRELSYFSRGGCHFRVVFIVDLGQTM